MKTLSSRRPSVHELNALIEELHDKAIIADTEWERFGLLKIVDSLHAIAEMTKLLVESERRVLH